MTVESVEISKDKITLNIYEPTEFGLPDIRRKIVFERCLAWYGDLPVITRQKIESLPDDRYVHQEAEIVEIEGFGKIVIINDFDTDSCSSLFRKGAHTADGPYRIAAE